MALKIIQLKNKIDIAKRSYDELVAKDAEFEKRAAEIETAIKAAETLDDMNVVDGDIETFETEMKTHNDAKETLSKQIADMESELNALDVPIDENKVERVEETRKEIRSMDINEIRSSKEYLHAWANAIKTGRDDEVRAILKTENVTGGTVPVPVYVEGRINAAWEKNDLVNRIGKSYFKGNLKVPYEVSSTRAAIHTEGTDAPTEETLTLNSVTLVPSMIKKWIPVTDEVLSIGIGGADADERFIDYIYDELTYRILKKFETDIIAKVNSGVTGNMVASSTTTTVAAGVYAGIGAISSGASDVIVVINNATWAKAMTEVLSAGYGYDPFAGLTVVKSDAVANDVVYVGDFRRGYRANFPDGETVRVVASPEPEKDIVKFVGKLYVGHDVVTPNMIAKVTISAGE